MPGWEGAAIGVAGGMLGAGSQHRRQKELMGIQNKYQRGLNKQGHDLQFDMWNKTNYRAQLEHMKAAGLNPALMYGSAGQGGQTGSQGGGSAASGNAAPFNAMDLSNMMLVKAETELKKKQGDLAESQADAISGYQKGESESRTGVNIAQTRKIDAEFKNVSEDTIKKIQETTNLKTIDEWNKVRKGLDELKESKQVTGSAIVDLMTQVGLDPVNNEADRTAVRTLLGVFYGSGVAKNIMQGIGSMKGNVSKHIGEKIININKQ